MGTKIFLDINVLVDFFDPFRAGHENAKRLFFEIESNEGSVYLSESVLNTFVYVLRKQLSPDELRDILHDLLSFTILLPCSREAYLRSLKLPGNDIEDALLYQLALDNELDYFITEDKKDFKKLNRPELPVISTKEFLNING
ncbi:MAG: type II toxin-antitoxin system VapC family toxin [Chitinophagaceae bacterium]|nr:type II toxin-antitoxin system VapC family toxin [Chitinophagaceae bacterium]